MQPLLSVVIETHTAELSSEPHVRANIDEIVRQIQALPAPGGEVILVCSAAIQQPPVGVRVVVCPGLDYYGLKNAGSQQARGDIVAFIDADCRPCPGYMAMVLEQFRLHPDVWCLAGASWYDGRSFLARLNTTLSFGYLHDRRSSTPKPYGVLAHNVAIRRSCSPHAPFGPWSGRVRGDAWLSQWFSQQGHPPRLVPELAIYHEDPSFSLKLRMDRQLREVFCHVASEQSLRPWTRDGLVAAAKAVLSPAWRARKIFRYGHHVGLGWFEKALAMPVILVYGLFDCIAVTVLLLSPSLRCNYIRYQNGPLVQGGL
ncbi:MAG: glycosyltransferase family 2 protein [Cyanobacteriota bacterium]|nr:glycosyltransferase family 2 protein [Cyanobacteriota bacterium]